MLLLCIKNKLTLIQEQFLKHIQLWLFIQMNIRLDQHFILQMIYEILNNFSLARRSIPKHQNMQIIHFIKDIQDIIIFHRIRRLNHRVKVHFLILIILFDQRFPRIDHLFLEIKIIFKHIHFNGETGLNLRQFPPKNNIDFLGKKRRIFSIKQIGKAPNQRQHD